MPESLAATGWTSQTSEATGVVKGSVARKPSVRGRLAGDSLHSPPTTLARPGNRVKAAPAEAPPLLFAIKRVMLYETTEHRTLCAVVHLENAW